MTQRDPPHASLRVVPSEARPMRSYQPRILATDHDLEDALAYATKVDYGPNTTSVEFMRNTIVDLVASVRYWKQWADVPVMSIPRATAKTLDELAEPPAVEVPQ